MGQQRHLFKMLATHFLENCHVHKHPRSLFWERSPCVHVVTQVTGSTATRDPGHALVDEITGLGDRRLTGQQRERGPQGNENGSGKCLDVCRIPVGVRDSMSRGGGSLLSSHVKKTHESPVEAAPLQR